MRTIAILLLSFLSLSLAIGADVRWTYSDFTTTAQTVKKVYITPIASYGTNGNTIITGDRRVFTNDSAGSLIVSNVIVGRSYRVEFKGAYTDTVITNSFDSTVTGFVEAVNYIAAPLSDGGLTSYSKTAADARFHNVSGDTSTNAAFRGTFKIPAGATVGYVLTVTNADGSSAWSPGSGSSSTSGALTNNDTRGITFLNGLTVQNNLEVSSISSGAGNLSLSPEASGNVVISVGQLVGNGGGLTNLTGAGSSIAAGTNIVTVTNGSLVTVHGTANVTQAGLAAGSYAINGVAITNIYPSHLNQSLMLNSNLKLANNCQTYNLLNVFAVFGIGDNAIPAASGISFQNSISRGLASFLPYGGSIFGGYDSSGGIFNSAGTATFVAGSGNNPVWHGSYWTYATGNAITNTSTDGLGVNATHLVLNCVQASGFGSFQVYTGRVGAALALFKTVDNNNGGAWTAYTTNCWLGGYLTNIIAAVVSTGTNISYGQVACGLYSTNALGCIFDPSFVGNGDIERCMTNATHSNAVAVLLKPYFDAVVWSDLNYSNAIYAGAKSFNNMMLPTASASSWHTDLCLLTGSPDTNNPAVATTRSAALRVGFDYEIPVFDSYSFLYPNTPARLYGLVPSADVHFTNFVGKMIGTKLVDWLGWSWSHQLVNGYAGLMSLPYVAKTNGTVYETFTVVATNAYQVVVKAVSADTTGLWMGLAAGTTLTSGNAKLSGDNSGVTRLNASSGQYIFNTINGTPYYYLSPSGGTVLGTVFDNSADPGAGKVRFNGDASFTGNIYASNSIAISTNFVGANFTPVSAFTKISGSNNAAYGITSAKTNLISAP